jgi:regulation of enolase protein 1 (concanavalin A-like superfamily)
MARSTRWPAASLLVLLSFACTSTTVTENRTAKPSRTPQPLEAEAITKFANVSFSTYSKEWPVNWQWIDPLEDTAPVPRDVKGQVLRVSIPSGRKLDHTASNAPRYVKHITGDFQIETRVAFVPKENYQGAGLLIYVDERRFVRFERSYGGPGGGADGLTLAFGDGETIKTVASTRDIKTDAAETELKIVRSGNIFTALWRTESTAEWQKAGEITTDFPQSVMAGLVAVNTARSVTAEFQYIRLFPN